MKSESRVVVWFLQTRAPFLILSVALTLIGVATAFRAGIRHWLHAVLLGVGVILAHVSVNLFNELSDRETGIDDHTLRTPFSGGSNMMQSGKTTPLAVRAAAYGALGAAALIGLFFFTIRGWPILALMAAGGLAIRFYTSHLARWLIGELASGLTLGIGVVLGVHYALTGSLSGDILFISIPPGILTFLLLFLNEFPDAEADLKGGRRHLVLLLGKKRGALVYACSLALMYGMIAVAPFLFPVPRSIWLSLLTLPLAAMAAIRVLKDPENLPQLVPALGMNVAVVILTDFLLALGYFL